MLRCFCVRVKLVNRKSSFNAQIHNILASRPKSGLLLSRVRIVSFVLQLKRLFFAINAARLRCILCGTKLGRICVKIDVGLILTYIHTHFPYNELLSNKLTD